MSEEPKAPDNINAVKEMPGEAPVCNQTGDAPEPSAAEQKSSAGRSASEATAPRYSAPLPLPLPYLPQQKKEGNGFFRGVMFALGICTTLGFVFTVVLVVLLFLFLLLIGVTYETFLEPSEPTMVQEVVCAPINPQDANVIALVDIKGVIGQGRGSQASAGALCTLLNNLSEQEHINAIILNMDTPGGEVIASDEIRRAVVQCSRGGIPVVTCMRSMAASGGYYIASGSNWIVANRMTFTGSIGVIISSFNVEGLGEKVGFKPVVFKSGDMKDALSAMREMTEAERQYIQQLVDSSFTEFCSVVAEGRNRYENAEAVKKAIFADGRILSGQQALELGLVDSLGGMEEAIAKAEELSRRSGQAVIRYSLRPPVLSMFSSACAPSTKRDIEVRLNPGLPSMTLEPGKPYFIMSEYAGMR